MGAVLPPFLDQTRPLTAQFVLFAATTTAIDALAMGLYGLAGAALTTRMAAAGFRRGFNLAVGVVLAAVAVMVALRH